MKATRKLYTVTDLGPGDGGKGGVVHKISSMARAHTVIKVGGAQGSHGVSTSSGDRFAFSQFGCGTLEGARTHLSPRFIALPEWIFWEAEALRYECGVHDAFGLLTIDEAVICATPYHGISSRIKELARGSNPRGTVGSGVGETFRFAERYPELTIRAGDLAAPNVRDRLVVVRDRVREGLAGVLGAEFLSIDRTAVSEEISLLENPAFLDYTVERFREVARRVWIVDSDYMRRRILQRDGVVVVESSHGILTDRYVGFHPHTSAIRTLPRFTHAMLAEAGYAGDIVNLGVTRAYQIRHGAGPIPTADPAMNETLLPGSHKEENRYQGKVRAGPLDLNLLRYAIAACGGPGAFHGLAVTWFDQLQRNREWRICESYRNATDPRFFTESGALRLRRGEDLAQFEFQENLGAHIASCIPEITTIGVSPDASPDELYSLCSTLNEKLGVDVRMVSMGPTERDKICR